MANSKMNKLQSAEQSKSIAQINQELNEQRNGNKQDAKPKKTATGTKQEKPKKPTPAPKPKNEPKAKKPNEQEQIPVDPNQTELFDEDKKQTEPSAAAVEPTKQEQDAERVPKSEPAAAIHEPETEPPAATEKRTPQTAAKKYDEPTKSISFKLPESAIDNMKEIANVYGVNTTQYLLMKINEDYEENKDLIERLREKRYKL